MSETTTEKTFDSDEEYEKMMNNNIENVLKTNNLSRNNRKETNRKSEEKFKEAKYEINKKENNTMDKDKDYYKKDKIVERTSEREMNNLVDNKRSTQQTENSLSDNKKSAIVNMKNTDNKILDKTVDNLVENSVEMKKIYNKTNSQTPRSENSFTNFAIDNVNNFQKIQRKEIENASLPQQEETSNIKSSEVNTNHKPIYKNHNTYSDVKDLQEKNPQYHYTSEYTKSNFSNLNDARPGERLYMQYMEKLPKKKQHQKKILEEKQKEEIKAAPFKPNILKTSQKIASKSPDRIKSKKIEDLLIYKGNQIKAKKNQESAKKNLKEYETHSFYPSVSEKSSIIASFKRKERLEKLSELKNKNYMNKSCDYLARDVSKNQTESVTSIASDEERYGNKYNNNNYINDNHNINSRKNQQQTNIINNKTSFVSSDYTFTNMKVVSNNSKNERNIHNHDRERNHTFETSQNDLTIRTPRSRTRSYSSNSPVNDKSSNNRYKTKTKNFFTTNADKKIDLLKDKTPSKSPGKLKITSKISVSENKRSKTPIQTLKLNPEKNIHDLLYVESDLIRKKKEEKEAQYMKENYPFHPLITESSKILLNRQETTTQFINRLMNSKKEAEELIIVKKKKNSLKDQIDSITGQPLFKPTINKGAMNYTNKRRINENLEGYHDNKLISEKKKIQEEEMLNNLEKKKFWLEKSMKSVLKMKIEKYKEIFDMLDSDKDGFISCRQIRLSALDSDMLTIMTPLLEDLQKKGNKMNFKEFCLAVDKFLPVKIFSMNQKK